MRILTGPERIYPMRSSIRIFAALFVAITLALLIDLWVRALHSGEIKPLQVIGSGVFLLANGWLGASAFGSHVRLSADAIEFRKMFRSKTLPMSEIRGRRERVVEDDEGGKTTYLKIVPWDMGLEALEFPEHFDFDTNFYLWYDELENLDKTSPS